MNKKELRSNFDREWKQANQTKYVVWLIFYIGSIVPLLIGALPLFFGNINDSTVARGIGGFVIFFVMEIVALVINLDRTRSWKQYLEEHSGDLKQ